METTPQLEKGFIQIATGDNENDVFSALIKSDLNGTEYQCALLVIRKTWGYKKKEDWISLTQFEKYTNKTRASVCTAIKQLVKKNILVKKSIPGVRAIYQLNKEFNQWQQLVKKTPLVKKTLHTSKENFTPLVKKTIPTSVIYTKETITKERDMKTFLDLFNKLFNKEYKPTKSRQEKLELRLKAFSLQDILDATANLSRSAFHRGKNDRGWIANPDFLIRTDEQIDNWLNNGSAPKQKQSDELLEFAKRHGNKIIEV